MKRILVLPLIALFFGTLMGQTPGQDYKSKGIASLRSNHNDSAMIFLNMALAADKKDGEVLGALALVYFQMGDSRKALYYARRACKQEKTVTADAFIAGALGSEDLVKPKQRDRWLHRGLKRFPGDYLLLYHTGRVNIPYDRAEGEKYLIRSVYAAPWFAESHYLLGQQMYRHGENLKAALPLFYFLLLENSTERSKETVLNIELLYKSWAVSDKGISKTSRVSTGFVSGFTPQEAEFKPLDYTARSEWFVQQSVGLLNSLGDIKSDSNDLLWEFYSDFFTKAVELDNAEALSWHLANARYPAELLEWVAGHGAQYKAMTDWLSVQ
jgi:hypothetical protein